MLWKIVISGAALLASGLAAAAAEPVKPAGLPTLVAKPGPQGYIGARYGGLWGASPTGRLIDEKTVAVNTPLRFGGFQLEGRGGGFFLSGNAAAAAMGAGHLYLRNGSFAWGGFGGFEVVPSTSGFGFGGIEAKTLGGPILFYGQVADAPATDGGVKNTLWARTGMQVFRTENLMLEGDLRYTTGAFNSFLVSGSGEFRRTGHSWAWHATLNYETGAGTGGSAATSLLIGANVHLGNSTLYQEYTTGAIWSLLPMKF